MWMSIYSASKYNSGYSFVDIRREKSSGGKFHLTGTIHTGVPITFIPETAMVNMDKNGHSVGGTANAMVPSDWFISGSLVPHIDDFITKGDIEYRIIGVEDFGGYDLAKIYYLYLRRDELAFGR